MACPRLPRVTSLVTAVHCAPTQQAAENLLAEGHDPQTVHVTGNTVIDALLWMRERVVEQPARAMQADFGTFASHLDGNDGRMVLITGHRRESFGEGLLDGRWCAWFLYCE